jgi:hypothetical protein
MKPERTSERKEGDSSEVCFPGTRWTPGSGHHVGYAMQAGSQAGEFGPTVSRDEKLVDGVSISK